MTFPDHGHTGEGAVYGQSFHDCGRVTYTPMMWRGMVGYRCERDDGAETFIYLNPSTMDAGDDVPNVFAYMGEHANPADDVPQVYHDLTFEDDKREPDLRAS